MRSDPGEHDAEAQGQRQVALTRVSGPLQSLQQRTGQWEPEFHLMPWGAPVRAHHMHARS
jgi:hypothetical protein